MAFIQPEHGLSDDIAFTFTFASCERAQSIDTADGAVK